VLPWGPATGCNFGMAKCDFRLFEVPTELENVFE
jgi:hypothetical protein